MLDYKLLQRIGEAVLIPIPSGEKGPRMTGWQKMTLADMTDDYLEKLEGQNIGVLLGSASKGLVTIDADSDEFLAGFLEVNPCASESLISRGARGGNVWVRFGGSFPKSGKIKNADGSPWGEFRADGMQTVICGQHPSGKTYSNNQRAPLTMEFADIKWPSGLRLPWEAVATGVVPPEPCASSMADFSNLSQRARAYVDKMPPAIEGECGSDATFAVAKKLVHDFALPELDAWPIILEYNSRCSPPWLEKDLRHKLEDASSCNRSARVRGELADSDNGIWSLRNSERSETSTPYFANSLISHHVEPPMLADLRMFGFAGDIVRLIEPHTETHPASLLVQLLVGFGNMIGRNPFVFTERDQQHTNLFCVIVGDSSRGRKGTSWGHVKNILSGVEAEWSDKRIMSGLASGEGVVAELADSKNPEKTEALDKRLMLFEGEFAQVLRVAERSGNTISAIIRNAWDSGELRNMSKGAPLRASGCHISLIGHITRTELNRLLTVNDAGNGFANRILWVHSSRTKLLPDGGEIESVDFTKIISSLRSALQLTRTRSEIKRSPEARDYWRSIYPNLTEELPGRWGEVTSRGEAQVVRLSLLFCLLEGCNRIEMTHLRAAEALWAYCRDSARWAFMDSRYSNNAKKILAALQGSTGFSRSQITSSVFSGHIAARDLDAALKELTNEIEVLVIQTGGAPAEVISLRNKRIKAAA
jgi:hypothetical protein